MDTVRLASAVGLFASWILLVGVVLGLELAAWRRAREAQRTADEALRASLEAWRVVTCECAGDGGEGVRVVSYPPLPDPLPAPPPEALAAREYHPSDTEPRW